MGEETTEMPRDTTMMDTTMMDTTKMPMDTTKMDYEPTKMMATPKMDYETTMKAIETSMMQYTTMMKDTTMMDTTMMKDTTMMDTTMPMKDTTMMDTTMIPTEAFEMYGTYYAADLKCQKGTGDRTFKNSFSDFVDVATCVKECRDDKACVYATTDGKEHCIGCRVMPTESAPGWSVYKSYDARRQLTAQEVLRIENAALRARLDKLMRN